MYEGIKLVSSEKIINLDNLPKTENGELILENIKFLNILISDNAKYNKNVEILENNSDVKISLVDESGNIISIILKGLNDILLVNNTEMPVFEVFQGTQKLASMTTIDDLQAAAAGGETIASAQDGNPDGAGDLGGTQSGDLAGRISGLSVGAPGDATDPTYAYDITFAGALTGIAIEDFSDASGILVNDDPHYGTQPYEPATIVGIYGTFTIDEAGNWFYDLDNLNPAVQALDIDAILTESFTIYTIGQNGTTDINITITGTNDQPEVSNVILGVDEVIYETQDENAEDTNGDGILRNEDENTLVTGQLEANDVDTNDTEFTFSQIGEVTSNNELINPDDITVIVNPDGTYSVSGDFSALSSDETVIISFQYTADDQNGIEEGNELHEKSVSESATVSITITGTNDQPVIEDITIEGVKGQIVDFYEDGSFVTAWIEYSRTEIDIQEGGYDGEEFPFDGPYDAPYVIVKTIYAQKYDANGNKIGEQVEVESLDDDSYIRSDIFSLIALSDGGFTVNWSTESEDGTTLAYERFNSDGTPTHEQVFASSDDETYFKKAQAVELNDGSIAVIWKQSSGKEENEIFVQKYDKSGNPVGEPVLIASENSGDENIEIDLKEFELEAFGESGFSVVWSQNVYESIYEGLIQLDSNEYKSLNSIIVDSDGNVSNPLEVSRLDTYSYYYKEHPEFSQLQDNGIITWVDSQTGEFIGQLISNSNELIGEPIVLLEEYDGSRYQSSPDIALLEDGSFVVTWLEYTYSDLEEQDEKKEIDGEYKLLSQIFEANGEPRGEVIEVYNGYASLGTPAHFDPSIFDVRGTEDGGFSIAWFNNEFGGGRMSKDSEIEGTDNLFYHFKFDSEGNLEYSNNPTQNYETKDGTNVFTGDLTVEDVDVSNTHVFRVVEGTVEIVNNVLGNDIFDERPSKIDPELEVIPKEPLPIPEVTISLENGQYYIEGDFNYLAVGESVTITFQYVADDQRGFDGTDGINEPSISEPKTITVTIKGTNDQPVLESLVNDGETVFETSKNNTGIQPEEPINTISGTITAKDDDIHDTHSFRLQYIDDGQEFLEQDENYSKSYQDIDYKRYADEDSYTDSTRVVVESNDIDANSITIEEIRLLTNDRADSQVGFELDGDFKALGVGETATVTFEVIGDDYKGFGNDGNELHEASRSEPHYVTITVEGTNDQPVVRDVNANGVNNYDIQEISNEGRYLSNASVAGLSDGGYIVTWRGYPEQGGNSEIFAQRYDAANNPVGSIFQVNAEDYNYDTNPEVVGLSDGGFVITWRGYDSDDKIFLQKFDEDGNKVGGEVLVNTQQGNEDNYNPAIAATDDGGYIVTWYSYQYNPFGSSSYEIYMQRFDNNGDKLGVETQVSISDTQSDYNPEIAVLPDGGFVVTWQGYDGSYSNIFMQIFDSSGNKVGTETVVNESDFNHDYQPSIAAFADGSFIITWHSYENGDNDIFAQKFDLNGNKIGTEFQVNVDDFYGDYQPKVTVLTNGDYVITWYGYEQGSSKIYFQKFDNLGNKIGEEQVIIDNGNNGRPDITALEDGGFVISYDGYEYENGQSQYSIASQRFEGGATFYESHDDDNEPDEYNDGEDNTQDDILSYFEGSLASFASDNDVNDVLTYHLVDGSVTIDNLAEDYTFPEVTVNEVTGEYDVQGNFNYLAAGETATVTFDYFVEDNQDITDVNDPNNELSRSEIATVTLTITGTNDQPIIEDVTAVVTEESLIDTDFEDFRYEGSVANSVTDDDDTDTHTFSIDEGTLTLSVTTMNQKFLDFFDVDTLEAIEQMVDDNTDINQIIDFIVTNDDNNDIADSVTIETAQEFTIPQNIISMLAQYGLLTVSMDANGDYSIESPIFNMLGAHDSITIGFDFRATDHNDIRDPQNLTFDGTDGVNESSVSEAQTVTVTIEGTNDKPVAVADDYISLESQLATTDTKTETGTIHSTFSGLLPGTSTGDILGDIFERFGAFDEDLLDLTTLTFHLETDIDSYPNAEILTEVTEEFSADQDDDVMVIDPEQTTVTVAEDGSFIIDNPTFDNLAVGETAKVTFQYYINDQSGAVGTPDNQHESVRSEPVTVTVTITGTNDKPLVHDVTLGIDDLDTKTDETIYESSYKNDIDDTQDDINTKIEGTLVAIDDDVNDEHIFNAQSYTASKYYGEGNGGPGQNGEEGDRRFDEIEFFQKGLDNGSETIKVMIESEAVDVHNLDISQLVFKDNNGEDSEINFELLGDFNALAEGETAVVTFQYIANDKRGFGKDGDADNEASISEPKLVTMTITGTNDQPVVQADFDSVYESTTGPVTTITTQLEVEDADDTDMVEGHIFHIQDVLPLAEVDVNNIYTIRYVNIDTNTIGFVQVEIDGPLQDIDTTKITLIIDGDDLTLQGEFDPLAGAYTDNSGANIPAEELAFRFKYFADDQNGFDGTDGLNENSLSDSQWMTITVTGTNDIPTIVDKNLPTAMDEDRHVDNGMLKTFGSVEIDDVDHGQDYFSTTVTSPSNDIGGTFNFNEDGTWDYEVDNSLQAVQSLKENEYIDQTYIVTSIDGTKTHEITVRIWGTEDISIIKDTSVLSGEVTEDTTPVTLSTTGALFIIDPDSFPDEAAFNTAGVFNASLSDGAQLGTLTLVNQAPNARIYPEGQATWTYTVDNTDLRVQELGVGETITQVFTITSADGNSSENVIITIKGTNDVPTLEAITSASIVDTQAVDVFADIVGTLSGDDVDVNASLTYSVSGTDLDPRDGVIKVEGNYGTLVLITSSGEYTYTPDADKINALSVDATDTFTFVANDGIVDSLPQNLVINITAADDTPIIVDEPDFSVVEDGAVFNGTLEATDVDTTTLTYEVVGATPAGLTVNPNGTYNFDPSVDAYQSLNAGQTTQVSFQWKATDGNSDTATDTVTVTIMGTNDGATIINPENFTVQAEQEQNFLRLDTNGQVIEDASQALNMSDFARVGTGIKALDVTGTVGPSQNGNNWNDAFSFVLLAGESALVTLEDATPADSLVTIYQIVAPNTYIEVPSANGEGNYVVRIASSNPAGGADFKLRIAIIGDDVKEDTITTVSGEMEVIDVDAGENIFRELTDVVLANGYGKFSISPTGTWTYELFNSDPRFQASLEENKKTYLHLLITKIRLEAESKIDINKPIPKLEFPKEVLLETEIFARDDENLFKKRIEELRSTVSILDGQYKQKKQELVETKSKSYQLSRSLNILAQERDTIAKLVARRARSNVDLLKLRKEYSQLEGELRATRLSIPRLEFAITEAKNRKEEKVKMFKSEVLNELQKINTEIKKYESILISEEDKLSKTILVSPVDGIIKQINVNTIGGVVKSGMDLIEIVPSSEILLVEAKIDPKDIAFINPKQKAIVKITAYDFSIYGGLEGKIVEISADSIKDKESKDDKSYYKVVIRTEKNYLEKNGEKLPIIPGMIASVDIKTGKKTILDFILKPILKTKENALHER